MAARARITEIVMVKSILGIVSLLYFLRRLYYKNN